MPVGDPGRERRTIHFRGRVQGVGFRYTAARIAEQFEVTGYVENLPDGRVLLVAEGQASEIDRFIDQLREKMSSHVKDVNSTISPATGEFPHFHIRA